MALENVTGSIDISDPFSPIYWGFVLSLLFGGVTVVQAYIYFINCKDRLGIQLLAALILLLDFIDSALVAYSIYYFLIPQFGSLHRLSFLPWELTAECMIASVISFISQMYFAYQLVGGTTPALAKRFGHGNWFIITGIVACTIASLGGGLACVVSMSLFDRGVLSNRNHKFSISFGVSKGFSSAADILATLAMCMFLKAARGGLSRTNSLLNDLVRVILTRGVLVTITQTLLVITFYALPTNLTWMAFHINVAKLYVNTFFAMLNGREHLKEKHLGVSSLQMSNASLEIQSRLKPGINGASQPSHSAAEQQSLQSDSEIHGKGSSANNVFMSTVVTTSFI